MGLFERFLTVWVGLGILAGVGLGLALSQVGRGRGGVGGELLPGGVGGGGGEKSAHGCFQFTAEFRMRR